MPGRGMLVPPRGPGLGTDGPVGGVGQASVQSTGHCGGHIYTPCPTTGSAGRTLTKPTEQASIGKRLPRGWDAGSAEHRPAPDKINRSPVRTD